MFRLWARRSDCVRIWHWMRDDMVRSECGNALPHLWANPSENWEQLRQDEPPTEGRVCHACMRLVNGDQRCQPRRRGFGRIVRNI